MTRCWLALVTGRPEDAFAAAHAGEAGWLAVWRRPAKPVRHALLAWPGAFDAAGPPGWASLVLPAGRVPFDDMAVQQARRDVLAHGARAAVTTLLRDASTFGGSLLLARDPAAVEDDPFARVGPRRILCVGPGLVGATRPPAGPTIERYGSAQPWPGDRFA